MNQDVAQKVALILSPRDLVSFLATSRRLFSLAKCEGFWKHYCQSRWNVDFYLYYNDNMYDSFRNAARYELMLTNHANLLRYEKTLWFTDKMLKNKSL